MVIEILLILLGLLVGDDEANALRSTAPIPGNPGRYYLTTEAAREHIVAARSAALETGTDPNLLLAIAHHESRYDHTVTNPNEPDGKTSCGVMTPEPLARCPKTMTVMSGYREGARHLRQWIDSCANDRLRRCAPFGVFRGALIGYAGGWRAIGKCTAGPVWIRPGVDGCRTPEVFRWREQLIRRAISRARRGTISAS